MGDVDEFLVFLLVGLFLLLFGLLMVFNIGPVGEEERRTNTTIFETQFDAAYVSKVQEASLGSKKLYNGLFFGSNEITRHVETQGAQNMTISFSVASSNNLAPLEIMVNGKRVMQGNYAIGDYTVDVPGEMLSDKMNIQVRPWSSLWKIWAANEYNVKNVRLELRSLYFGKKESAFLLSSDQEFDEARVELVMDKNIGSMKVELNDKEVFSGFARDLQSIKLNQTVIRLGENKLEIIPNKNSRFSGTARVVVFSGEPQKAEGQQRTVSYRPLSVLAMDP